MKINKQNKLYVVISILLIQQLTWGTVLSASETILEEELSDTVRSLKSSRSIKWDDSVDLDREQQESSDSFHPSHIVVQSLKKEYPKPSSFKNGVYRNMPEDGNLMKRAIARQHAKLKVFRFKKKELDELTLREIAEEEKRQREEIVVRLAERAKRLALPKKKDEEIVAKSFAVEEFAIMTDYAAILLKFCNSFGLS